MSKKTGQKAFTIIEVLIYIALFSLLMAGVIVSVYSVIQATDRSNIKVLISDEANFVLRKINWALTGIDLSNPTPIIIPAEGDELSVDKYGLSQRVKFRLVNENIEIDPGIGVFLALDSDSVKATTLSFEYIPPSATGQLPAVKTNFYLNDFYYETTKFIRK
ncbi:MAG: type II secretion system protein [Patescibacteria group bacterium]